MSDKINKPVIGKNHAPLYPVALLGIMLQACPAVLSQKRFVVMI